MKTYPLPGKLVLFILILATILLSACSRKPLVEVCIESAPRFSDDLDMDSLKKAVQDNLEYLQNQPPNKTIQFADRSFSLSHLTNSLEHFLKILAKEPSPEDLDQLVKEDYDIYQATGTKGFNPGRKMLITGYFQPVFEGSLSKKAPYLYPLFATPDDLLRTESKDKNGQTFSRLQNGKIVPYWTREEIETGDMLAGQELVWLKDPFDAFVLHVQGSGLIRLQDGTIRGVHYAAKNGQKYRSIGKHLVQTGRISLEKASLKTIREYVTSHPEERNEILHHNPSFIFFQWTESHGAIGNLGKELTAGRSLAVDQECFPAGGLAFLLTRKPEKIKDNHITWSPLSRFVVVQDTGSAIRGPGRADLFWGTGSQAGLEAGQMKEKGTLYFLLLKEKAPSRIAHN